MSRSILVLWVRHILRLPKHWPWTSIITHALACLAALPNPG
ncbi:hypothetical protein [Actinomadura sp. RB99]|nr:hypothetical protein [Actinomadura sp. RB99]